MKKLFCFVLMLGLMFPAYSADQWDKTDPAGTESPADLDSLITTNNGVLDLLLRGYREGAEIAYSSSTTITVGDGYVALPNSTESTIRWRRNTSDTSVTFSNLDTGSEEASTTYYVYAVGDADATTFTVVLSKSATSPTGVTYYKKLGSIYNDSSSNILDDETIVNDNNYYGLRLGDWTSKSNATAYLASTDGFVTAFYSTLDDGNAVVGYTDASNPPTTTRIYNRNTADGASISTYAGISFPVKSGDYYKVTGAATVYWIPNE